jgi:hypothetical protein
VNCTCRSITNESVPPGATKWDERGCLVHDIEHGDALEAARAEIAALKVERDTLLTLANEQGYPCGLCGACDKPVQCALELMVERDAAIAALEEIARVDENTMPTAAWRVQVAREALAKLKGGAR